jgi:hypothetical protein
MSYTAGPAVMAMEMKQLPLYLVRRQINIITSDHGALLRRSEQNNSLITAKVLRTKIDTF